MKSNRKKLNEMMTTKSPLKKVAPLAVLFTMSLFGSQDAIANTHKLEPQGIESVKVPKIGDVLDSVEFKNGSPYYGDAIFKIVSTSDDDSEGNVLITFSKDVDQPGRKYFPYRHITANATIMPEELLIDRDGYWIKGTGKKSFNVYGEVGSDSKGQGRYTAEDKTSGVITIRVSYEFFKYIRQFFIDNEYPLPLTINRSENLGSEFHDLEINTH